MRQYLWKPYIYDEIDFIYLKINKKKIRLSRFKKID